MGKASTDRSAEEDPLAQNDPWSFANSKGRTVTLGDYMPPGFASLEAEPPQTIHKGVWARLEHRRKEAKMAMIVKHHQDCKDDIRKASEKLCECQGKLRAAEYQAKRYGTKPPPSVVQAYMRALSEYDELSNELRSISEPESPFSRPLSQV